MKKLKINIKGTIVDNDSKFVYDWFGMESTSPKDVSSELDKAMGDVEVEINSGGGYVYAGSEIYTILKNYSRGKVKVNIVGVAASAASVIAMAGDEIAISPTAQIMIHNVQTYASGDYRDLRQEADVIENYNKSIANAYRLKTGLTEEELLDLMDKETWLDAKTAVEKGFSDKIMFDEQNILVASYGNVLPVEVVNKVRESIMAEKNKNVLNAKLNLLKLKEVKERKEKSI